MFKSWHKGLMLFITLLWTTTGLGFVVKEVKVDGLSRMSASSIVKKFDIKKGEEVDVRSISKAVKKLYGTGLFSKIDVLRHEDQLLLRVKERPIVVGLTFTGNKRVKTEVLEHGFKEEGVEVGRILKPYALKKLERIIMLQYRQQGYGDVVATVDQNHLGEGKVAIEVKIEEGAVLKVRHVRIHGHSTFSARVLKRQMHLAPELWSFMTGNNHFSEQAFAQDRQAILWYYQDHGYLDASIPKFEAQHHKHDVTLVMKVVEGKPYHLKSIATEGTLESIPVRALLKPLVPGALYKRREVMAVSEAIKKRYADHGYADVQVHVLPKRTAKGHKVDVRFLVMPGTPVLVRRVEFSGNTVTTDRVLRQEMLQLEHSMYSQSHVQESIRRINNLGYIKQANCQRHAVQGRDDVVDLMCSVTEDSTLIGSLSAGFSSQEGLLYRLSIDQKNFLGTGRFIHANFERSDYSKKVDMQYTNPYFLPSGVSQSWHGFFERTTPNRVNITSYKSNAYGGILNFSMPVSHFGRLSFGGGFVHTKLLNYQYASSTVRDFVTDYGDSFREYRLNIGWAMQTLDRMIFPTRGGIQSVSLTFGLPMGDGLRYMRGALNSATYWPLAHDWIAYTKLGLGYGRGYGHHDGSALPFFKNFYAGGIGSVRGFVGNALGPRDDRNHALGGNVLMTGSLNLITPPWFGEDVRTLAFLDGGSVFDRKVDWDKMRLSAGIAVQWRTPMAPIILALGFPLKKELNDRVEKFAFTISTEL